MEIDEESSTLIFDFEKVLDNEAVAKARGDNNNNNSSRSGNNPRDSSRSVVCKHWLRGLCKKGDYCEFLHEYDLSKMPECYFFSRFGECSNPECQYLHIKPEERIRECPWYNRGFCKHGPRCRHKHVKRIACANYLAGFCPDGPKCDYGHAKYELRLDGFDEAGGGKPRTGGSTRLTCHACGLSGHRAAVCPNNPGGDNVAGFRSLESVTCYKCSRRGHYANACPRAGAAGYVAAS